MHYGYTEVLALSSFACNTLRFIIPVCFWIFHIIIFFKIKSQNVTKTEELFVYMTSLIWRSLFHHLIWERFGNIKMQMQMTYKVLCQLLTGSSYLEEVMLKKFHISNECLKNTSHNVVPSRITKCDYRDQPWMTVVIKKQT